MASDCALCAVDLKRSRVVPVPLHLRSGRVGREEKKEDACNSIDRCREGKSCSRKFPHQQHGGAPHSKWGNAGGTPTNDEEQRRNCSKQELTKRVSL